MGIWEILVGALVLIFSIIMIIVIILQEGHDSGLGTITGGADLSYDEITDSINR